MSMQSGFAAVFDAQIYYEIAGAGEPLVLIHGWGLDHRMWDDQFRVFAERYRVLRYDQRGFGKSTVPGSESYSYADDLAELLRLQGIDKAVIIGLSMGGWVATNFVLNHPTLARVLVLVDSAMIGYRWSEDWSTRWAALEKTAVSAGPAAATALWLQNPVFGPAREHPELAVRLADMVNSYSAWHWVNKDRHRRMDPPDRQRLNQITIPTQIILGERDLPDFHAIAEILRQGIPGARMATIPGAGHMSNMEAPHAFNRIVQGFLDTL